MPILSTIPDDLNLQPRSRRPTVLADATASTALQIAPPLMVMASQSTAPLCSIILITCNGEMFTRLCIASVLANTPMDSFELIIVDNQSTDSTRDFLAAVARHHSQVQVVLNETNRGFAAANNQGLLVARGEYLVLLNSDTVVAPGWLAGLIRHLQDPLIGIVGPTTNRAANESEIPADYITYKEFLRFSDQQHEQNVGSCFDIPMLTMFAVVFARRIFEAVGLLDESFELGMFEDDDYCHRVRIAGFRLTCAQDVFVHHFGQGSFGALVESGQFNDVFERNRARFESKWNVQWQPHRKRGFADYGTLADRLAETANLFCTRLAEPIGVISRGDEFLLQQLRQQGRDAAHFPTDADGRPRADHPLDGRQALEWLRQQRIRYLLIPRPYLWWLDYYGDLAASLTRHAVRYDAPDGSCVGFDLSTLPFTTMAEQPA